MWSKDLLPAKDGKGVCMICLEEKYKGDAEDEVD